MRYWDIRFFPRVTGMSAKISISAQERENDLKSVPEQLVEVKNRIPGHISLWNKVLHFVIYRYPLLPRVTGMSASIVWA